MFHPVLIASFLLLFADGLFPAPQRVLPTGGALAVQFGVVAWLSLCVWGWVAWCGGRLDRFGEIGRVRQAERACAGLRWGAGAVLFAGVLWLGALEDARAIVGDLILVDELMVLTPVPLAFGASYWVSWIVERRVRDAMLLRDIETGRPVYPVQSRAAHTWMQFRHGVLVAAVPLAALLGWSEAVAFVFRAVGPDGAPVGAAWGLGFADGGGVWAASVQLGGAIVILALTPLAFRWILDTAPLGRSTLRDRLVSLFGAHRVRVRNVLLWRTNGVAANGMVMGILPGLRYVVLSDALIDHLSGREVEAVTAHEVAHIRRRHLPWLIGTVLGAVAVAGTLLGWAAWLVAGEPVDTGWVGGAILAGTLGVTLAVMSWVSRRFERQADAYAVQHLSVDGSGTISAEAVATMCSALGAVARLNGIRPERWTWRHGSILERIHALRGTVGEPVGALAADRGARAAMLATVALVVGGAMLLAIDLGMRGGL